MSRTASIISCHNQRFENIKGMLVFLLKMLVKLDKKIMAIKKSDNVAKEKIKKKA